MNPYLKRVANLGAKYARHVLYRRAYLYPLELLLLLPRYRSDKPQLFIVGLPRSGTTLIYQYIVHRLKVAYFTNGVGRYPLSPCLTTFIQHRLHGEYRSDFRSNYGKVIGPNAPREAGGFWGRFFSPEDYTVYNEVKSKDEQSIRNIVACVQRIFGDAPFVNKNVKHMLRVDALSRIFPSSYFLTVERNIQDVALSVIRGRYKEMSDPLQWWSVRPPDYPELKDLPLTEQIAYQLSSLRSKLEVDLSQIPESRILRISYEQFCKEPETLIIILRNALGTIPDRNEAIPSFAPIANEPETAEEKELMKLVKHVF